jgi:hypothetical protein
VASTNEQILETLRAEHRQFVQELLDANKDLVERADRLGLDVNYDHENDELLCTIDKPVEAATVSIANTVYFRYDPDTLRIVGFGVLGLRAHAGRSEAMDRLIARALLSPGDAAQAARDLVLV